MKQTLYFKKIDANRIKCNLCPHHCILKQGETGICRVRKNINSELYSLNYGKICSAHFDPVEKKPLYHFFPGKTILSLGSVGCNLHCKNCQNYDISQSSVEEYPYLKGYSVKEIINIAKSKTDNIGIAYTYNEPTVWYEYMLDIAKEAKKENLKNVMVTNGYINKKPLEELTHYIDAFSVDLKGWTEEFYKKITSSKLEPVKDTLKLIKKKGNHLEITNLVIPTLNDAEETFEKMVIWIANETGKDTVLHISRYFPIYKLNIRATSVEKLLKLYNIAKKHLDYVYVGNVIIPKTENTYCSKCGKLLIERQAYTINDIGIDKNGNCKYCGNKIVLM